MKQPVLLGGRSRPRVRGVAMWHVLLWLPVVLCLLVISRESTDSFAAEYTSGPLRRAFVYLFGPVAPERWIVVHHYMRKTGHFLGYGFTGLAWARAWLLTWLVPLRQCRIWLWRRIGVAMGLLCTAITASLDELHQTYIPSRTGLMSDAWLDTAGAAAMLTVFVLLWLLLQQEEAAI